MAEPVTTDSSTRTPRPAFQGWRRRRGGRWWMVATGATEGECLSRLLDKAKEGGTGSYDSVILPAGQEP